MNTFEVDKIVSKRIHYGVVQYLIKWKGFSSRQNDWEPCENMDCPNLIGEFELKQLQMNEPPNWDPKPKKILKKHDKTRYYVEWADGTESWINHKQDHMDMLISKFDEKHSENPPIEVPRSNRKRVLEIDTMQKNCDNMATGDVEIIYDERKTKNGAFFLADVTSSLDKVWIPSDVVKRTNPQKVIEFYQRWHD